jgi:hypothetical protein
MNTMSFLETLLMVFFYNVERVSLSIARIVPNVKVLLEVWKKWWVSRSSGGCCRRMTCEWQTTFHTIHDVL